MGHHRAAFAAGVAVGFIAGARAGRERYDQIVKFTRETWQNPKVQRAAQTAQAKASELSKAAATQAPKVASAAARQAKHQAGKAKGQAGKAKEHAKGQASKVSLPKKVAIPKVSVHRPGWHFGNGHAGTHAAHGSPSQSSVNGASQTDSTDT